MAGKGGKSTTSDLLGKGQAGKQIAKKSGVLRR
jgi:hypothetical protein